MPDDTATIDRPNVHQALLEAAQAHIPPGKKKFAPRAKSEALPAYLTRLVERIAEVPQEMFDAMPEPAQAWFNKSAEDLNERRDLTAPEGIDPDPAPASKPAKEPAAAKPAADPKPAAERAPRKRAEMTAGKLIRLSLIEDQSLTVDQIKAKLEAAGFKDTKDGTISSYRADTLDTLRLAASVNKFEPNPKPAEAAAA